MGHRLTLAEIMSTNAEKIITLRTHDNQVFKVEDSVISQSQTIKQMIENSLVDNGLLLPDYVQGFVLPMVLRYCRKHAETSNNDHKLKKWDDDFLRVYQQARLDLMFAAKYLKIQGLLDLTCETIYNRFPEEFREILSDFNKDLTPEERNEFRDGFYWTIY